MTDATRDLVIRALALPPGERLRLAHEPLGSDVADDEGGDTIAELDPRFLAEINRRAADDRPGVPAADALREVERRLAEHRRARDRAGRVAGSGPPRARFVEP